MATIYLRSTDGSDSDDGASWATAKATLTGAFAIATPGDTILVSHQHVELSGTSITYTSPGTAANPVKVICVNDTNNALVDVPTGSVGTGGSAVVINGSSFFYGLVFNCASGNAATPLTIINNSTSSANEFDNCLIKTSSFNGAQVFTLGGAGPSGTRDNLVLFNNTKVSFNNAGGRILITGPRFVWQNTPAAIQGTIPTGGLLRAAAPYHFGAELNGVDLSALGANPIVLNSTNIFGFVKMANCRLGASAQIVSNATGVTGPGAITVEAINCDSADTNYRYYKCAYQGVVQHDTANYRVGGWSDGAQPVSHKIVTGTGTSFVFPLESAPIIIPWNATTGSAITLTAHVLTDGVTLTDGDAWLEVEYPGTTGYPLSAISSDRMALLGTPVAQSTSTETWTTSGVTSPTLQRLSVSITPQKAGPIQARVMVARPSTTVWLCPKLAVS